MKKNMYSRRGVSLAEVVVALLVISIISVATMSVILLSAKQETKSMQAFEVRNSAENAIECFRFASGQEGGFDSEIFIECLEMTTQGKSFAEQGGSYVLNAGSYLVKIALLTEQEKVYGFSYLAADHNGEEIFRYTFRNGGVQG